jgi:hypothetical protein
VERLAGGLVVVEEVPAEQDHVHLELLGPDEDLLQRRERVLAAHGVALLFLGVLVWCGVMWCGVGKCGVGMWVGKCADTTRKRDTLTHSPRTHQEAHVVVGGHHDAQRLLVGRPLQLLQEALPVV